MDKSSNLPIESTDLKKTENEISFGEFIGISQTGNYFQNVFHKNTSETKELNKSNVLFDNSKYATNDFSHMKSNAQLGDDITRAKSNVYAQLGNYFTKDIKSDTTN